MQADPGPLADWLLPAWHAPGVGALMTTRQGGVSRGTFESLNLRDGLGDDAEAVRQNKALLKSAIGAQPVFLNQVHGAQVVRLFESDGAPDAPVHTADASVTTQPGLACAAQVADCLPVLFAAPNARAVGAAHAGWRGLALGVLEATLDSVCKLAGCAPSEVNVWLGACIGPRRFEVGADVLKAFGAPTAGADTALFVHHRPGKWLANLPQLARERLRAAGVQAISGGEWCTVKDASRFFSFRRDRVTGRMAAAVWIERRHGA
ncbi:MAG: peptidoglycan editing factor PgeF [Burkholderiales bacterium]